MTWHALNNYTFFVTLCCCVGTQDIYTGAIKKECMDYIILDHTEQESLCFEIPRK